MGPWPIKSQGIFPRIQPRKEHYHLLYMCQSTTLALAAHVLTAPPHSPGH